MVGLAACQFQLGQFRQTRQTCQRALDLCEPRGWQHGVAVTMMGHALKEDPNLEQLAVALKNYEEAFAIFEDVGWPSPLRRQALHLNIATVHHALECLTAAERHLELAWQLTRPGAVPWELRANLAILRHHQGRLDEAGRLLDHVLSTGEGRSVRDLICGHLAAIVAQQGDAAMAGEHWAAALHAGGEEPHRALGSLATLAGQEAPANLGPPNHDAVIAAHIERDRGRATPLPLSE